MPTFGPTTASPIRRMGTSILGRLAGSLADDGKAQELAAWGGHALIDYLGRLEEQRLRDCQADGLGRFEVNDQFELRRLLHRQVGGLGTLQDLVNVDGGGEPPFRNVDAIGQ